jgi:hypothetical protein
MHTTGCRRTNAAGLSWARRHSSPGRQCIFRHRPLRPRGGAAPRRELCAARAPLPCLSRRCMVTRSRLHPARSAAPRLCKGRTTIHSGPNSLAPVDATKRCSWRPVPSTATRTGSGARTPHADDAERRRWSEHGMGTMNVLLVQTPTRETVQCRTRVEGSWERRRFNRAERTADASCASSQTLRPQ